jgi:hypothetical protein
MIGMGDDSLLLVGGADAEVDVVGKSIFSYSTSKGFRATPFFPFVFRIKGLISFSTAELAGD